MESRGYAVKLEYINRGKQAKLSQQERALALKAEQVEAEALRSEKERQKQEAEAPEKQALNHYKQQQQQENEQEGHPEGDNQDHEALQVISFLLGGF